MRQIAYEHQNHRERKCNLRRIRTLRRASQQSSHQLRLHNDGPHHTTQSTMKATEKKAVRGIGIPSSKA